jgi:hypothetical protein
VILLPRTPSHRSNGRIQYIIQIATKQEIRPTKRATPRKRHALCNPPRQAKRQREEEKKQRKPDEERK